MARAPRLPDPRFTLAEFGAGFADVGVLLPIAIALIALNGLNPTTVFVGTGLMYVASGLFFRVPVAVQPLKAMAALVLASGAGADLIGTAGVVMGVCLLLLSLPGPLVWASRLFPLPIVRGVQLGVGLLLLEKSMTLMTQAVPPALTTAGLVITVLLWCTARRWSVLLPLLLAAAAGFGWWYTGMPALPLVAGPVWPSPPALDFAVVPLAFYALVLPQLPLTMGNAVMAASRTARDHFGAGAHRVTPARLCRTLGLGNIVIGCFGGMPVCHGAGGMTAHIRYGAKGAGATVMFGLLLASCGLLFGAALPPVAGLIPAPVLGAFLAPAGWAHAGMVRDVGGHGPSWAAAVTVGIATLIFHSMLWGVVAGWAMLGCVRVAGLFPARAQ